MLWFPLAIGAAIFWSVGQILIKRGFETIPPLWNNILNDLLSLFIYIPAALLLGRFSIARPPSIVFIYVFLSSMLYHVFFYAISKGQISLTGTVVSGYPVATIVLSYFFLNERLTLFQYAGIALILSGCVTVALPENHPLHKSRNYSWILWGMAGAVTIGTGDFITKLSINIVGAYTHIVFLALVSNGVSWLNFLLDGKNRKTPVFSRRCFLGTFIGIIIHLTGAVLFLIAFNYGKVSLIVSVSSVYPALVALMAVKFLDEKISAKQAGGIATAIIGLILIGIGTF